MLRVEALEFRVYCLGSRVYHDPHVVVLDQAALQQAPREFAAPSLSSLISSALHSHVTFSWNGVLKSLQSTAATEELTAPFSDFLSTGVPRL